MVENNLNQPKFGVPERQRKRPFQDYEGKLVKATSTNEGILGVYKGVKEDDGARYACFHPSIVFDGHDYAHIVKDVEQRISCPLQSMRVYPEFLTIGDVVQQMNLESSLKKLKGLTR